MNVDTTNTATNKSMAPQQELDIRPGNFTAAVVPHAGLNHHEKNPRRSGDDDWENMINVLQLSSHCR